MFVHTQNNRGLNKNDENRFSGILYHKSMSPIIAES